MRKILIAPQLLRVELGPSFVDRSSVAFRVAESAGEAIEIATWWTPDLIIFSSALPGMGAREFCGAIRAVPELAAVKLLMLTDRLGDVDLDELMKAEPDAHLVEPISEDALLHTMGALLELRLRQGRRAQVDILARLEEQPADGGAVAMLANIVSLGESGVLIETERQLTVGAVDRITFVLPGADRPITASGVVAVADELHLRYGIEFIELGAEDAELIQAFTRQEPE